MNCFFYTTPIGTLRILQKDEQIISVLRTSDIPEMKSGEAVSLERTSLIERTCQQLEEYFEGKRQGFDLPLAPEGTVFQKKAWETLKSIPYGETISYGEEARRMDCKCARAVGSANGRNPIIILIPCHRVICADGSLGGYTGGSDIKEYLLELERKHKTANNW